MSKWKDFKMTEKVMEILDIKANEPEHHFGQPFMTPYQIAIEFQARFAEDFEKIGKPIGGKNTQQHDSLAQYIAKQLSSLVSGGNCDIEGAFLYNKHLKELSYNGPTRPIESSIGATSELSLFRLKKE